MSPGDGTAPGITAPNWSLATSGRAALLAEPGLAEPLHDEEDPGLDCRGDGGKEEESWRESA